MSIEYGEIYCFVCYMKYCGNINYLLIIKKNCVVLLFFFLGCVKMENFGKI